MKKRNISFLSYLLVIVLLIFSIGLSVSIIKNKSYQGSSMYTFESALLFLIYSSVTIVPYLFIFITKLVLFYKNRDNDILDSVSLIYVIFMEIVGLYMFIGSFFNWIFTDNLLLSVYAMIILIFNLVPLLCELLPKLIIKITDNEGTKIVNISLLAAYLVFLIIIVVFTFRYFVVK